MTLHPLSPIARPALTSPHLVHTNPLTHTTHMQAPRQAPLFPAPSPYCRSPDPRTVPHPFQPPFQPLPPPPTSSHLPLSGALTCTLSCSRQGRLLPSSLCLIHPEPHVLSHSPKHPADHVTLHSMPRPPRLPFPPSSSTHMSCKHQGRLPSSLPLVPSALPHPPKHLFLAGPLLPAPFMHHLHAR